jgi:hypothetical protein
MTLEKGFVRHTSFAERPAAASPVDNFDLVELTRRMFNV